MATGDKLVNLDELKLVYDSSLRNYFSGFTEATSFSGTDLLAIDTGTTTKKIQMSKLTPTPYVATITSGQWSGSGSDYYITVTASNVTADSILIPNYDGTSQAYLKGPVWCVPAAGSFTIHTSAIPSGTVTILVQFVGVMGTAQYQVLSDVYSKSQVDSIVAQSTANIGTHIVSNTQTISVAPGAFATLASVNLSPGAYIVIGRAAFGVEATGRNIVYVTTNSSGTANSVTNSTASNGRSTVEVTMRVGLNTNETVYLRVYKDIGTGNVDGFLDAIKLA